MQASESPPAYLKRCFAEVFEDLSPFSSIAARQHFHPSFLHEADHAALDLNAFLLMLQRQKARLKEPPRFAYKSVVATEPCDGRVHVTSVHHTSLALRDGSAVHQKVIALVQIDLKSGQIVHCEELTRNAGNGASPSLRPEGRAGALPTSGSLPLGGGSAPRARAAGRPASSRPAAGPISFQELEDLRAELFADDVPILPEMITWSREAVRAFFELPPTAAPTLPTPAPPPTPSPPAPPTPKLTPMPMRRVVLSLGDAGLRPGADGRIGSDTSEDDEVSAELSRSSTYEKELNLLQAGPGARLQGTPRATGGLSASGKAYALTHSLDAPTTATPSASIASPLTHSPPPEPTVPMSARR